MTSSNVGMSIGELHRLRAAGRIDVRLRRRGHGRDGERAQREREGRGADTAHENLRDLLAGFNTVLPGNRASTW